MDGHNLVHRDMVKNIKAMDWLGTVRIALNVCSNTAVKHGTIK